MGVRILHASLKAFLSFPLYSSKYAIASLIKSADKKGLADIPYVSFRTKKLQMRMSYSLRQKNWPRPSYIGWKIEIEIVWEKIDLNFLFLLHFELGMKFYIFEALKNENWYTLSLLENFLKTSSLESELKRKGGGQTLFPPLASRKIGGEKSFHLVRKKNFSLSIVFLSYRQGRNGGLVLQDMWQKQKKISVEWPITFPFQREGHCRKAYHGKRPTGGAFSVSFMDGHTHQCTPGKTGQEARSKILFSTLNQTLFSPLEVGYFLHS